MDATTTVAVAGLVTTLLAPLAGTFYSSNRDRDAWERNILDEALTESIAYVQHFSARIDELTDPQATFRAKDLETSHRDLISAKLRLHAPKHVFDAWEGFTAREDRFWYEVNTNYQGNRFPVIDWDDDEVKVATAIIRRYLLAATSSSNREFQRGVRNT